MMKPENNEENEENETLLPLSYTYRDIPKTVSSYSRWAILALSFILAVTAGYWIGRQQIPAQARNGLLVPPGSTHQKWHHNLTFTQKPDDEAEAAWGSIIPVGRGFITHPQLAPDVSNIAVFHQIHCLHAIYIAYYDALASAAMDLDEVPDFDNTTGTRTAPFHIRHCFDYIRQALMCHADTNLEVLDPVKHTTNGWNQTKTCRDYSQVKDFAEKYANSSDTGIVT
ncbi:unnamed protein product [Periconia digitata]|uniref:Oxidase ustYa n=1 Tax=Periconia digitata TaxID=1303443 RepID=A0A9W4XIZ3_9PLEO|nr:unnamed protein product [Periconia digitata]